MTSLQPSKEEAAWARIANGLTTASRWDEDVELLMNCRSQIPFSSLIDDDDCMFTQSRYSRPDDFKYEGDDLFLKRLTLWFKMDFMTWVNSPPCSFCGCNENMVSLGTRGPVTDEERDGEASRVEVYNCPLCNSETTFPRYNSPKKLLQTRKGRCGEFANLFGLVCRSVGFEVRYILDLTDHVWVEVFSYRQERWIMADSCEGKIDAPLMYEFGWNKKLSHIFAYYNGDDGCYPYVADVTKRYTRKFHSEEMQARRAVFCTSEQTLEMILAQINASWRVSKPVKSPARLQEMERRKIIEEQFLQTSQTRGVQIEANPDECEGRLSGSLAWRASRDELGLLQPQVKTIVSEGKSSGEQLTTTTLSFQRESLLPSTRIQELQLKAMCLPKDNIKLPLHKVIIVSNVECAVGDEGLNIVIIDEKTGCILQSRLFTSWKKADNFVNSVPDGKIIAMTMIGIIQGEIKSENQDPQEILSLAPSICGRLGGFPISFNKNTSLAFIGQIGFRPKWAATTFSSTCALPGIVEVRLSLDFHGDPTICKHVKLVEDHEVIPRLVFARLPENIMPLNTQLLASEEQKKQAALVAMNANPECVGYVTKNNYPIYLFSAAAFPLQPAPNTGDWRTYYCLPTEIAPAMDLGSKSQSFFEVPVNFDFFSDLLGRNLISGKEPSLVTVSTQQALQGKRLIALYFSAHWCPPCRQFTPIFSEFYSTLKEVHPEAMEVVFLSSDRDFNGFQRYFSSMPWLSLPFDERFRKESIGSRYGIRGIPAVVIIDAISGVVVSQEHVRNDIMHGCQRGDKGVVDSYKHWLTLIPEESKMIVLSIQLSLQEEAKMLQERDSSKPNPYLVRQVPEVKPKDPSETIKCYFTALVSQGKNPTTAAAEAIARFAAEQSDGKSFTSLETSPFDSMHWEMITSVGAVVVPNFKWNEDCRYFSDGSNDTLLTPQLTSIRWLISTLTGNIIGVQSLYNTNAKGSCHCLLPEKRKDEWVECVTDYDEESTIIEGFVKDTGILLQTPQSKEKGPALKEGSFTSFILSLLPGSVPSGLHGVIAPTGIVALGLISKMSNTPSNGTSMKKAGVPRNESLVIACTKKVLLKNENDARIIANFIATAKKYVQNAQKEPFNPKFRTFKLNNKVSDRMAQVYGGIDLLRAMHFSVFCSSSEYIISLNPYLDKMDRTISTVEKFLRDLTEINVENAGPCLN